MWPPNGGHSSQIFLNRLAMNQSVRYYILLVGRKTNICG